MNIEQIEVDRGYDRFYKLQIISYDFIMTYMFRTYQCNMYFTDKSKDNINEKIETDWFEYKEELEAK